MSTNTNRLTTILTGAESYFSWKGRIRQQLLGEDLWSIVDGSEPKPEKYTDGKWRIRAQKARLLIENSLDDRYSQKYSHVDSAEDVFDAITELFEKKNTAATASRILADILARKWDSSTPMSDHLSLFDSSYKRLAALNVDLEEIIAHALLNSMPTNETSWASFVPSLLNNAGQKIQLEDVQDKLSAEDERLQRARQDPSNESALRSSSAKGEKHCSLHGRTNHSTDECWTLKKRKSRKKKGNRRKGKEKAHRADEDSANSDSGSSGEDERVSVGEHVNISKAIIKKLKAYEAFVANEPSHKKDDIIADSGASTHMIAHRDWFVTGTYRQ